MRKLYWLFSCTCIRTTIVWPKKMWWTSLGKKFNHLETIEKHKNCEQRLDVLDFLNLDAPFIKSCMKKAQLFGKAPFSIVMLVSSNCTSVRTTPLSKDGRTSAWMVRTKATKTEVTFLSGLTTRKLILSHLQEDSYKVLEKLHFSSSKTLMAKTRRLSLQLRNLKNFRTNLLHWAGSNPNVYLVIRTRTLPVHLMFCYDLSIFC